MLIPAMAPDERPLLFEESPLEDSASEVPEVEVSDSEAVDSDADADVVIGCEVDEESYRLLTLTWSLRQATNFRKDGAVCSIIYILHTRHKPMLPALIPLVVGTQEDRTIGNTVEIVIGAVLDVDQSVCIIGSPRGNIPMLCIGAIAIQKTSMSASIFDLDVRAVAYRELLLGRGFGASNRVTAGLVTYWLLEVTQLVIVMLGSSGDSEHGRTERPRDVQIARTR